MSLLYGIHDREGRHILPPGGWCVDTIALSENPAPTDYAALRADINWIVRLNWGYGSTGTIPLPQDAARFIDRLAHYVHNSTRGLRWIIGNEPNHEQERPDGVYITPERYAYVFMRARTMIKTIDPSAHVIPAPCAPYHANPVKWTDYWREMLGIIAKNGGCDGLAVHAYTRSSNPDDITSGAKMGAPLQNTYSGFYTYKDALDAVPLSLGSLPAYVTEFNELLPDGWQDANTGVVQAAYADIDSHNQNDDPSHIFIHCLVLYRWPKFDKWHIEGKRGVIEDFKAAIQAGYTSPVKGTSVMPDTTFLPSTPNEAPPAAAPELPREIDPRLKERGVTIETPPLAPGQQYSRIVKARWYDEQESQGRHHIYVEALSPDGKLWADVPFLVTWPTGSAKGDANGRAGFDAGNFPMSPSRNEFSVRINNMHPSETLKGIGMGAETPDGFNAGIHTSTGVVFQLVTMPRAPQPTKPAPSTAIGFVAAPSGLNIRTSPTDGDIITAVPYGELVTIIGVGDSGWLRVRHGDIEGWAYGQFIGVTKPEPLEPVLQPVEPTPTGPRTNDWSRIYAFIKRWEGGFANDPNDPGGPTNKGVTLATYTRWRQVHGQPQPTVEDLRNISDAEVEQIFFEWYYLASGADKLPWPVNLAQADTAVNAGPGKAAEMLAKSNGNFMAYMGHLIDWYTRINNFEHFGRAWIRRRAEILLEASK